MEANADQARADEPSPNPRPTPRAGEKPCAYEVRDGAHAPGGFAQPGELYFCRPEGFSGTVPKDQEDAKQQLEDACSVLRLVFQSKYPAEFEKFFKKLWLTAQAAFDPVGFRPQPLNDLARFRNEVTQAAGGRIKSEYVRRMFVATMIASILIVCGTLLINFIATRLKQNEIIVASVQAPVASDGKMGGAARPHQEIPNLFRWEGGYTIGHMGILLVCSMWGLFIAAISRNFEPSFEKLITPDADLMPPWSRLLFFGIVILGIACILYKRMITVAIGDIFSTADITKDLVTAGLIGLFLGIAERALPRELESWAGGFLSKIQEARETS